MMWFRVFLYNKEEDSEVEFLVATSDQKAAIKRAHIRKRPIFGVDSPLWEIANVTVEVKEV